MKNKRFMTVFSFLIAVGLALFIYACSSGSSGGSSNDTSGPPISNTPMEITQTTATAEAEDIVELIDDVDITDDLEDVGDYDDPLSIKELTSAIKNKNFSKIRLGNIMPITYTQPGDCPQVSDNLVLGDTTLPDPYIMTFDYGTTCAPATGSMTITVSGMIDNTVGDYSGTVEMDLNNFSEDGEITLNGNIIQTFNVTYNNTTGQYSGTVSIDFNNFSDGEVTIDGGVTQSFDINIITGVGTVTVEYDNITDGTETLDGSISITTDGTTATIDIVNMQTSAGVIDMTITAVRDDVAGTTTINTVGVCTYHGVTITLVDVVISDACDDEPISGVMTLSDGTTTATITFNGTCDGSLNGEYSED